MFLTVRVIGEFNARRDFIRSLVLLSEELRASREAERMANRIARYSMASLSHADGKFVPSV